MPGSAESLQNSNFSPRPNDMNSNWMGTSPYIDGVQQMVIPPAHRTAYSAQKKNDTHPVFFLHNPDFLRCACLSQVRLVSSIYDEFSFSPFPFLPFISCIATPPQRYIQSSSTFSPSKSLSTLCSFASIWKSLAWKGLLRPSCFSNPFVRGKFLTGAILFFLPERGNSNFFSCLHNFYSPPFSPLDKLLAWGGYRLTMCLCKERSSRWN